MENSTPERKVAGGEIALRSPETTTIENVEVSNEKVLEHAADTKRQIEEQVAEVLSEAEQKIAISAKSMNVSPEMLDEMSKEKEVDGEVVSMWSEAKELARKAAQDIDTVVEGVLITPESYLQENDKGQLPPTPEEREIYKQWRAGHPENYTQSKTEVVSQSIEEFSNMVANFEATYPLEELLAITELTPPDYEHPLRDLAKKALNPIFAKLNALKNETNIPSEKYEELKRQWKVLSNAVGLVNKGMVDHTR